MNEKAGSMSSSVVWLFALVGIILGVVVSYATANMGALVSNAIFAVAVGGCAWAGVFLSKATTGKGILAFLVGSLGAAVAAYIMVSMMVSAATSTVTAGLAGAGGADSAHAAQAGAAVGNVFGAFFGVILALKAFAVFFAAGIAGSIAGGKFKAKILAERGGAAKAA